MKIRTKPSVVFFICSRFAGAESKKKKKEEIFHPAQLLMPESQETRSIEAEYGRRHENQTEMR